MKKECTYVFLPTEEASPIGFDEQGNIRSATEFGFPLFDTKRNFQHKPVHLYILSEDEIKGGDWVIHESHGIKRVLRCEKIVGKSIVTKNGDSSCWIDYCKKIIATTSPKLSDPFSIGLLKKKIECVAKISLSDIEYIISLYNGKGKELDIEKIARLKSEEEFPYSDFQGKQIGIDDEHTGQALRGAYVGAFENGFKYNQDNLDKKFTTEQILHAIEMARQEDYGGGVKYNVEEIIQYLTTFRKDRIEVEYELLCIQTGKPCGFPCIGDCNEEGIQSPKLDHENIIICK